MKDVLVATLPAALPTLMVLVGILLNQNGINRLDARITALDAGVASLPKQLHDDIIMLVGRDTDKAERLARLEERSKG